MREQLRALVTRVKGLLLPSGSVFEQSVVGGIWSAALNVSSRVLQLLTLVVLARFLPPRSFGVLGAAMLAIVALRRVSKLGLDDALIYNESSDVDDYLDTVWVMNALRGLVVAGVLYLAAPAIASLFSEPMVQAILQVMALGPLVFGLKNPAVVYFRKDLAFHKQFVYRISGDLAYFVVAVAYVLVSPTVWALAYAYLARTSARALISYAIDDYRPYPSFDRKRALEMVDYGKWIMGGNILNYVRNEGDDIFVGWLLSSAALGFYQMAYRFSNAPATEVTHVISRVSFPAYSAVQDNPAKLRDGFLRTIRLSSFLVAPMAVGIAVVTPTFVRAVFGKAWLPMVIPMQILAFYGLARGFSSAFGSVWQATGHPDYQFKLQLVSIVLIAIPIYPATSRFGITGTAAVVTGVYVFAMVPLDTYVTARVIEASPWRVFGEFLYPLVPATIMGVVVLWVQQTLGSLPALVELVVLIVVGAVTYALAVVAMDAHVEWGILEELAAIREVL